ncbi:MAG: hypothetical protein ACPGLY_27970 [Rubripirellula sp.]
MFIFLVKLISVKPISELSSWELFDLMANARHVAGKYWIFEGDVESLLADAEVHAEGETEGTGDFNDEELVDHCEDIFGIDLDEEPASWQMLNMHKEGD